MSQGEGKERCLVCRQPVAVGDAANMLCALRGDTMLLVGHLCKACKEQALREAEPQDEDEGRRQVALSAEQERLLWFYHEYLRRCGFAVCRRKSAAPGALGTWQPVGLAGERAGTQLIAHFARWLEQQERGEPADASRQSASEEGSGG